MKRVQLKFVNGSRLWATLAEARAAYQTAEPFPHLVIDGFLRDKVAAALEAQFPRVDHKIWKHHLHPNSHKFACNVLPAMAPLFQAVIQELNSKPMLEYLEAVTGIPNLLHDDELEGGGLHQIVRGGYLKVHADFNVHPTTGHYRRLNLLLYLNRGWEEDWDGSLELWSRDMSRRVKSVAPILNRCVLFNTTDFAYHGHPRPLACPPGAGRKSIALYYYTVAKPEEESGRPHSTLYQRTGDESALGQHIRFLGHLLASPRSLPQTVGASIRGLRRRLSSR